VGERSTRWLSTRWAGLISDQWYVPTRTNRDYRSLSHGHTYTNGVRPYQTSSNGGGRALLGAPVKRFAGRRFVPPRHLCLAKTKWRRSQEQPHEALSAAVRANTRSRVRRLFSETGTLSLYHRAASSPLIPSRGLLLRRRFCGLCRLHLPLGSLLFSAHRVFLRLCGGHLHENDSALDDRFFIRVHRRNWEALYPSSLSTSYPLGTWSRLCTFGTPFVVGDHSGGLCCGSPRRL